MKKNLFDIVSSLLPDSENIHISDNTYTDTYFKTGFSCPGVFIGFDFFSDADRANYEKVIRALNKRRTLSFDVIKFTGYVAGISVRFSSDYSMFTWIESERLVACASYWDYDHKLRQEGATDAKRNALMKCFHFENVSAFLVKFSKVAKIA